MTTENKFENGRQDDVMISLQAFQIAAEVSGDIMFIFDTKKQSILVNNSISNEFGVLEEQFGVPYEIVNSGIVSDKSKAEYIRLHEAMINGEKEVHGIVGLKSANNETGIYELSFKAMLDSGGNPTGKAVGVYKDVTSYYAQTQEQLSQINILKKKQEDFENKTNTELKRQLEVLYALSSEYSVIVHINLEKNTYRRVYNGSDYAFDEVKFDFSTYFKLNCEATVEPAYLDLILRFTDLDYIKESLKDTNVCEFVFRSLRRGWIRTRFIVENRNDDGVALNVLMVSQVIDEEREKELNYQEALKKAYESATYANAAKTTFLSNMSHDIRTPMNAIIGFASLAVAHIDDKEKVDDCLKKILSSSEHLQSLINEILDMSRIESGKTELDIEKTSRSDIIKGVMPLIQPQVSNKQLEFVVDTGNVKDDFIYADSLKIRQVLVNILGNAVKFTHNGGNVSLKITEGPSTRKGYSTYSFVIKDTGIGMSAEFLPHVFEPFERANSSTLSGTVGTGLGMSITKHLVEIMGGTISVESELGNGTTFTVKLDLELQTDVKNEKSSNSNSPVNYSEKTGEHGKEFSGARILLVEDNELNRELAVELLKDHGLEVDTAVDGLDSIEKLKVSSYNYYKVVLMDIQMPKMDGYEATRQIRQIMREDIKNIPIVAMTANAFVEDVEAAEAAGMNDHLAKPLDMEKVINILHKYIK